MATNYSIVGQEIRDFGAEKFHPVVFDIQVDRLDQLLQLAGSTRIALTKMDVQGFECLALEGMGSSLLDRSDAFHFEYSRGHLEKQNCTDLYARFRRAGFDLFRLLGRGGAMYLPHQSPKLGMANFIAYKASSLKDSQKLFQKENPQATVQKVTISK